MNTKVKIAVVVTNKDEKVLLIKEKVEEKPKPLWNIIKGSYDGGETIFDAAMRECREEASIDVELTHSLGVYASEESEKIRVQFNFLAHAKDGASAQVADAKDQALLNETIEEVRWFTKEEIQAMHPDEFVSSRSYELLMDWVRGESFPLNACKQVKM